MTQDTQQHILALHERLERLDSRSLDAGTRESLLLLLNDLTRLLGPATSSGYETEGERPLTDRLDELALRFEAEHPAIGTAVRQLIDALSKAGI